MNNIFSFLSKKTQVSTMIIALMGLSMSFTACKNDDDYIEQPITALSIINASPTTGTLNFFLDNQMVGSSSIPYPKRYDYLRAYSGTRTGKVTDSATNTTLYTKSFNLIAGKYQSLYIIKQNDTLSYAVYTDEIKETGGKAQIRFINLSADSPALNLVLEGDTTTFNDRIFKAATPFKNVTPAKYTLLLKNKATGTVVATLADVPLVKDTYYTIWARGLATTSVDKQKLGIEVDKL